MKINVYSLEEAVRNINGGSWISIRDKGFEHLYESIDNRADDVLALYFDDVDPYRVKYNLIHSFYVERYKTREPIYFNKDMASDIYNFVLGKKEVNIHCFAGVSRSQAVGHVINIFFNCLQGDEEDFIKSIPNYSMVNPLVIDVMMRVFKERIYG